jgi:hypothetical protein
VQVGDCIYGTVEITEAAIQDVLASQAVQRLKGVLQHGISALIGITTPVSRYDHSLGVMLLIRRLGGDEQEQIAGLLHDVSHTAFSHVIDYVVENHTGQSYHDEVKAEYVAQTDLPAVLAGHGYDWHDFLDEERYPLLEQPSPALCADRLDYFLRDAHDLGLCSPEASQRVLDNLVVHEGRIMVRDEGLARWLAHTYMAADDSSWADFREVGLYELAAYAIRLGLDLGVITEDDFWETDQVVWDRLLADETPILREAMARVSPDTRFVWDAVAPDFRIATKIRTIDPDVVVNGTSKPLSVLDPAYGRHQHEYKARKAGRWPYRVIDAV